MINEGGDYWGTFNGTVGTQRGPRLRAVYTRGDAVINLGEVRDACFTDPTSCVGGFTVSLWLRHWTVGVKQDFVLIGRCKQTRNYIQLAPTRMKEPKTISL